MDKPWYNILDWKESTAFTTLLTGFLVIVVYTELENQKMKIVMEFDKKPCNFWDKNFTSLAPWILQTLRFFH